MTTLCFLGRYQESGSWRSRLYLTNDDGQSYVEQDIGQAEATIGGETTFGTGSAAGSDTPANRLAVAAMTDTLAIALRKNSTDSAFIAHLLEIQNDDTVNVLDTLTLTGLTFQVTAVRMSDTECVVVGQDFANTRLTARLLTIDGDELVETTVSNSASGDEYGNVSGILTLTKFSATALRVTWVNSVDSLTYSVAITKSATSLTWSSTIDTVIDHAEDPAPVLLSSVALTSNKMLLAYKSGGASPRYHAMTVQHSPFSPGNIAQIEDVDSTTVAPLSSTGEPFAVRLDSERALVAYNVVEDGVEVIHCAVLDTLGGNDVSPGTAVLLGTVDDYDFQQLLATAVAITSSSVLVAKQAVNDDPNTRVQIHLLSVSGTTISGAAEASSEFNVSLSGGAGKGMSGDLIPGSNRAIFIYHSQIISGARAFVVTAVGGGGQFYAIDMSLDKSGSLCYVTGGTGTDLVLLVYEVDPEAPAATLVDVISLGAATLAQIAAKTYVAYVRASWFSQELYVYGRFQAFELEHVIFSGDAGLSFNLVDGANFGKDHIGSLAEDIFGNVFAIRNYRGGGTKLYRGSPAGLQVALTLPLTAVNSQGLHVDTDGIVFVGSGTPAQTMVLAITPPYSSAKDITYDHSTARGINAIHKL